ncbi:hypothetical protein L917_12514, partial [Phytophthora nicotianae]
VPHAFYQTEWSSLSTEQRVVAPAKECKGDRTTERELFQEMLSTTKRASVPPLQCTE